MSDREGEQQEFRVVLEGLKLPDESIERINRSIQKAITAELANLDLKGDLQFHIPRDWIGLWFEVAVRRRNRKGWLENPQAWKMTSRVDRPDGRLCPSSTCEQGSILLGIVRADGRIAYLDPGIEVDEEFVETARKGRSPEKRFRFAAPCVEEKCTQWTGSACGAIEHAVALQDEQLLQEESEQLPNCAIRPSCRWFSQIGGRACRVCPFVITDTLSVSEKRQEMPAGWNSLRTVGTER